MPMQNYTPDYLMLYYFNETDMTDSVIIQKQIDNCQETEEEYLNMVTIFDKIDEVMLGANESTIQKILAVA